MNAQAARETATAWVQQHGSQDEGFQGAYLSGSIIGLADEVELPASSDVDIVLVTPHDAPAITRDKFHYRGALLEATYLPWSQLSSPEAVLASYHLAGSFRVDTIIADPTGRLHTLQAQVVRHFADRVWVQRRCEEARDKVVHGLGNIDPSAPFHEQVLSWVFPTGVTTHVVLVAALANPTVRRRYLAARQVLTAYGHDDLYAEMLDFLGCAHMTQERAAAHMDALSAAFDAAAAVGKTPFSFSSDITPLARPVAIGGSREMIRAGDHREAVFWMVVTSARCQSILAADASAGLQQGHATAFGALMADLGIANTSDLLSRADRVMHFIPGLWKVTNDILDRNPAIIQG